MIDVEASHNYQCLICGHTSSVYRSFLHHMEQHPSAEQPTTEYPVE
jgi:hypothetical protein